MPVVFAARGSGRPKPPRAEVCKHAAHIFRPRRLRLHSLKKLNKHENEPKPRAGTACATHSPRNIRNRSIRTAARSRYGTTECAIPPGTRTGTAIRSTGRTALRSE